MPLETEATRHRSTQATEDDSASICTLCSGPRSTGTLCKGGNVNFFVIAAEAVSAALGVSAVAGIFDVGTGREWAEEGSCA